MPLTEVAVRNARADEKPRKLFDAHGLFLFVTPRGGKLWRLKYRFGGKEKLLSLGPYPLLGLKDARDARDAARRMLNGGDDPGLAKATARQATLAEGKNTFRQIADEYRAKLIREGRATGTLEKIEWYLTFVLPALGDLDVRSITAAQILEVLRVIITRPIRDREENSLEGRRDLSIRDSDGACRERPYLGAPRCADAADREIAGRHSRP